MESERSEDARQIQPHMATIDRSRISLLVIDGISGVPLGKELMLAFADEGMQATHFDCLAQPSRFGHALANPILKAVQKLHDKDNFFHHPSLDTGDLDKVIRASRPSHILVVGFAYKFYSPAALKALASRHGARLLLYDTDSCNLYPKRREFVHFIQNELPVYDQIFSFSSVTTRFFRDTLGLPAVHLPFGASPLSTVVPSYKNDVLFVGSADLRRIFLLEHIREHVLVRGNRWRRNNALMSDALKARVDDRTVWGSELQQLLQSSRIVLNITRSDFFAAETGVNLRIFEALAAGSFLLTDYCEEVAELLEPGKDIETFGSSRELCDKVAFYLNNESARQRIARNGHARFLEQHTWRARVRTLLSGLSP